MYATQSDFINSTKIKIKSSLELRHNS